MAAGLRDHAVALHMAGLVCTVDAAAIEQAPEARLECLEQIACPEWIAVTKSDLGGRDAGHPATQLRSINPAADIVVHHSHEVDLAERSAPRVRTATQPPSEFPNGPNRGTHAEGRLELELILAAEPRMSRTPFKRDTVHQLDGSAITEMMVDRSGTIFARRAECGGLTVLPLGDAS